MSQDIINENKIFKYTYNSLNKKILYDKKITCCN